MKPEALALKDVHFSYKIDGSSVRALNGISFAIQAGEMVAIQGPSGSGKSTLLYLLGCMLKPQSGDIRVNGREVGKLNDLKMSFFRNRHIGFVFQQFHLLPSTDVLTNILLPTEYPLEQAESGSASVWREKAVKLATRLGLGSRLDHRPQQLSGGQQQRVAIARALIRDPHLILADEPTGNLDSVTSSEIMDLLRELNREGKTVVIITHDNEVAAVCDRIIQIRDGVVINPESETKSSRIEAVSGVSSEDQDVESASTVDFQKLIKQSLPQAIGNMKRNRFRTFLTMLGVVVGVASIVAMLTLGTFIKDKILQSYATLGVNTLVFIANPNWALKAVDRPPNRYYSLNLERDVWPLKTVFPAITRISPVYQAYNNSAVFGGRSVEQEVSVMGVSADALAIIRRELAVGAPIQPFHVENQSSVCVIGFELAQRLFQRQSPLNQSIQVAVNDTTFSCSVIGVMKPVPSKETRGKPDLQVVIPYTYFINLPFEHWYLQARQMWIEVDPQKDVDEAGREVQAFFQKRYGKSGNFRASSDTVLVAQMKRFLNLFSLLLVSIAALSLLVGGMGITNMMLVSVNERLREIGLRKAVGATHHAIRQLFFAESLFLCLVAGLAGVVIGIIGYQSLIYAGSQVIKDLKFEWVFNPTALIVSLVAIVATGLLSGVGPALKAEKLQVIEALRSE